MRIMKQIHRHVPRIVTACLLFGLQFSLPRAAHSTPAYSRRYDTACTTCHSPLPPRLNNVGMLFHRAGFRLPDSDDNGNLVLKAIPAHGVMDAASMSSKVTLRQDPVADPGASRTSMGLDEVELVAGTAIDDHLSTQFMFLPLNSAGAVELEDFEAQANIGPAARQFVVRAGKMQTMLWQKANHGGLTPSMPLVLDEMAAAPVGDFGGFALGAKQIGLEAGYTFTQLKKGKVLATMLSAAVLNGVTGMGEAASRNPTDGADVLLQAYELFGSRNTLGAFYYRGRTVVDPEGVLVTPGPFRQRFDRQGVVASIAPVDWFEVDASAVVQA